jgi:hypothetical protein
MSTAPIVSSDRRLRIRLPRRPEARRVLLHELPCPDRSPEQPAMPPTGQTAETGENQPLPRLSSTGQWLRGPPRSARTVSGRTALVLVEPEPDSPVSERRRRVQRHRESRSPAAPACRYGGNQPPGQRQSCQIGVIFREFRPFERRASCTRVWPPNHARATFLKRDVAASQPVRRLRA